MTKHFEKLWEEGEQASQMEKNSLSEELVLRFLLEDISSIYLPEISEHDRAYYLGKVLLGLCRISNRYNINVYAALQQAINDVKVDLLE
jgi:hypothetical protein